MKAWLVRMALKLGLMWVAARHDVTTPASTDRARDERMKNIAAFVVDHERELSAYIQAERKRRKAERRA